MLVFPLGTGFKQFYVIFFRHTIQNFFIFIEGIHKFVLPKTKVEDNTIALYE